MLLPFDGEMKFIIKFEAVKTLPKCRRVTDAAQVLNLFLALLLSSFGAESLKHSEEDEGPNKLQEAVDRINRFSVFVKSHFVYYVNVYIRNRRAAFVDDPDAAYGYLAGPNKPRSIAAPTTHDAAVAGGGVVFSNGHVHEVETSPDGVDGISVTSPQQQQANGEIFRL